MVTSFVFSNTDKLQLMRINDNKFNDMTRNCFVNLHRSIVLLRIKFRLLVFQTGVVVKALDSKTRGCGYSAFHSFEVDQMSTRNFWGLSDNK